MQAPQSKREREGRTCDNDDDDDNADDDDDNDDDGGDVS